MMKDSSIKIGDFGQSRVLSTTKSMTNSQKGTPYYFSPEITKGLKYSYKSDIWALGVLLYEMCALELPFTSRTQANLFKKIQKGKIPPLPECFSPNMSHLIKSMLRADHEERVNIGQICETKKIQKMIKKTIGEDKYQEQFDKAKKYDLIGDIQALSVTDETTNLDREDIFDDNLIEN